MSNDGQPITASNQPVFTPDNRNPLWWLKPGARLRISKIFPVFTDFVTARNDIIDAIANSTALSDAMRAVDLLQLGVNSLWYERYPNEARIKFSEVETCWFQYAPVKDALSRYMNLVLQDSAYQVHDAVETRIAFHRARADLLESMVRAQETNIAREASVWTGRSVEAQHQNEQLKASRDHALQEFEKIKALNIELRVQIDNITQRQARTAYQEAEALKKASHFERQLDRVMHENRNLKNQLASLSERARKAEESSFHHFNIATDLQKQLSGTKNHNPPIVPSHSSLPTPQGPPQSQSYPLQPHPIQSHQPQPFVPGPLSAGISQTQQPWFPPTGAPSIPPSAAQPLPYARQGGPANTTPSTQTMPLKSPLNREQVPPGNIVVMHRPSSTPANSAAESRAEARPIESSHVGELASTPVFLRLFNHMFEQVSGLPKIQYECTFCRKKVTEGNEVEKIGDDPNEWMTHCRTIHPKMYGKAMSLVRNKSGSPTSSSPPIPAATVSAAPVQSAAPEATIAPENISVPARQPTPSTAAPSASPTPVPAPGHQDPAPTNGTAE